MSGTRLDALQVRKGKGRDGNEQVFFTKIGVAFPVKSGEGYMLQLEAIPAPEDGAYRILLKPPQEKREGGGGGYGGNRGGNHEPAQGSGGGGDDDIPF